MKIKSILIPRRRHCTKIESVHEEAAAHELNYVRQGEFVNFLVLDIETSLCLIKVRYALPITGFTKAVMLSLSAAADEAPQSIARKVCVTMKRYDVGKCVRRETLRKVHTKRREKGKDLGKPYKKVFRERQDYINQNYTESKAPKDYNGTAYLKPTLMSI